MIEEITPPGRHSGSAESTCLTSLWAVLNRHALRLLHHRRGQEQSRKAEDIRREMLSLGEAGYREVTLLGQNIDAYGR